MEESSESGALVAPPKERAIDCLLSLEPRIKEIAEIEIAYIDNIDSANMNPEHWEKMTDVIERNYGKYDGFVITHGTNSMAYTASALSYILGNLGKPVVLTGSQIPGGRIETDARRNFVNAVRVATMNLAGVFLVFDEEIILGARASKVSESKLNAFETINWDMAGEIRINIRLNDEVKKRHGHKPEIKKGFENNVAVITVVPGTPVKLLNDLLDNGVKGLVLSCYGPGDIGYDYIESIEKAAELKVPVVITTQCLEGATLMHVNDVGQQALNAGAIQAYDMSIESITTKLMWALKHFPYEKIERVMHANYVGEINKEGRIY